jgi:ABC-type Zn uptake system ZnuABC Zn-binding protein ZnuA
LATRLSNVGSFDPAGTIAEIEKLAAEVKARKDEATDDADQQASTLTEQAVAADSATIPAAAAAPAGATPDEQASAQQAAAVVSEANSAQAKAAPLVADTAAKKRSAAIIAETNVSLYQLQPKLQQCVVRAKI